MSTTTDWKAPLCERHATEHAVRTGCVICAMQKRYDALRDLMPYILEDCDAEHDPVGHRKALDRALAVLAPEDRPNSNP